MITRRQFYLSVVITGILVWFVSSGPSAEEKAAQDAHARKYGHHCLSQWDGSHPEAVRELKKKLRDPDSFKHSQTLTSLIDDRGEHSITMEYRAKNGFGGLSLETARGSFRAQDCKFIGFL